jgi:hypothetical protein
MPKIKFDLTSQRFGRLEVIQLIGKNKHHQPIWECRCDCGNITKVISPALRYGSTKSCGCLKRDVAPSIRKTHGHFMGRRATKEYRAWLGLRHRCRNKNYHMYHHYGGRGISWHPMFDDFEAFLKEVGPAPSPSHMLDRKDNNRGYEPGNLRWVTPKESVANRRPFKPEPGRRSTGTVYVTVDGISGWLFKVCKQLGLDPHYVGAAIRTGRYQSVMNGISIIEYGKVYLTEERYTDMHGHPRISVTVDSAPHVGEFLNRFGSLKEAKAWVDGGERTVTKRYVDGTSKTFAKR